MYPEVFIGVNLICRNLFLFLPNFVFISDASLKAFISGKQECYFQRDSNDPHIKQFILNRE